MAARQTHLILKDKTRYTGTQFGSDKTTSGEVVFLTGMMGYTEALTDPSFAGQILVFTYPLVGNYGVDISRETLESKKIWAAGVVVSSVYDDTEHATADMSFSDWLKKEGVPGIAGVDTRALAQKIRDTGTQLGKLGPHPENIDWYDPNIENIVARVSCEKPYTVGKGKKPRGKGQRARGKGQKAKGI
jgi:carbamoyl-phosphate synthase small subunit